MKPSFARAGLCCLAMLLVATIAAAAEPTVPEKTAPGWTDWRGPNRDAVSSDVPTSLPAEPRFLWRTPLTSPGLAGIAATAKHVVVADKDQKAENDIFRCLDAGTGKELWQLCYPAAGEMDYTNSARANPVIWREFAYLLGAFGDLHCVKLADGKVVWKANVFKDFGAEMLHWGACSAPLVVDGKIIINPGAEDASVVALDALTGKVIWKSPGTESAYSGFIVGAFGGVRQIVGYDSESLGGWDIETGKRLWSLTPPEFGDFNVPTPVNWNGKLILSTENNGTRIYEFDETGKIKPEHQARSFDLSPDTISPVVTDGLVFGTQGALVCLDAEDSLKFLWNISEDAFYEHVALLAGNGHVMAVTQSGEIFLVPAQREKPENVQRLMVVEKADFWSHPALVGNRLYLRGKAEIMCLLLN